LSPAGPSPSPCAGVRKPPGGSPSSAVPLPLPYIVVSVWLTLFAVADGKAKPCRWEAYAGGPKPVALMALITSSLAQLTGIF
jgi:hypothetical protein